MKIDHESFRPGACVRADQAMRSRGGSQRHAPRAPAVGSAMVAVLTAALAIVSVAAAQQTPPNDTCSGAIEIGLGAIPFSTLGATSGGPDLPIDCEKGFGLDFVNDVWYLHLATYDGTLEVSTCGAASFDTRLAAYLYDGSCADLLLVACNDDGPGCPMFTSIMQVPVSAGRTYAIRLGGFFDSGQGILTLTDVISATCIAPGHGCFTVGLPGCDDLECCSIVCAVDPFCCASAWDFACVESATALCVSCGAPGSGNCCSPNQSAACDDPACCQAVCGDDPFCCDTAWDALCVARALLSDACGCTPAAPAVCATSSQDCFVGGVLAGCTDPVCCTVTCTFDPFCCDVRWDEECVGLASILCVGCGNPIAGDCCSANGSPFCNDGACCDEICAADSFCCEIAWDSFCAAQAASSPFCDCGAAVCPAEGDCREPHPTPGCSDTACCLLVCSIDPECCVVAWDIACANLARDGCDPGCGSGPCPADLNGDGQVNGSDLGILLSQWGQPGGTADLDCNGLIDGADLGLFLAAWGACPGL